MITTSSRNDSRNDKAPGDRAATRPCPVCGEGFTPQGRARYCSGRCRQEAFRRRHPPGAPEVPVPRKGLKRAVTVYECDGCGERALGDQYCADCGTFTRAIGIGGLCPHCDGAVTIQDLLEGGGCQP